MSNQLCLFSTEEMKRMYRPKQHPGHILLHEITTPQGVVRTYKDGSTTWTTHAEEAKLKEISESWLKGYEEKYLQYWKEQYESKKNN